MVRDVTYELARESDTEWTGESLRISDKTHDVQDVCVMRGLNENPSFKTSAKKLESEIRDALNQSPFLDNKIEIVRKRMELWNNMLSLMKESLQGVKTTRLTLHDRHLAILFTNEPAIMVERDLKVDGNSTQKRVTQSIDMKGVVSIGDNYGTTAVIETDG